MQADEEEGSAPGWPAVAAGAAEASDTGVYRARPKPKARARPEHLQSWRRLERRLVEEHRASYRERLRKRRQEAHENPQLHEPPESGPDWMAPLPDSAKRPRFEPLPQPDGAEPRGEALPPILALVDVPRADSEASPPPALEALREWAQTAVRSGGCDLPDTMDLRDPVGDRRWESLLHALVHMRDEEDPRVRVGGGRRGSGGGLVGHGRGGAWAGVAVSPGWCARGIREPGL